MFSSRRDLLRTLSAAAFAARLPLRAQPGPPLGKLKITRFVTHKASLRWRDLLFLEIHTDGGLVGIGEASIPNRVEAVEQTLRWLESYYVGQDPAGVEDHWDRTYWKLSRWRHGPVAVTAQSAVDIALWDLEGKRLGVPVWRLLGGAANTRLRAYFTHFDAWARDVAKTDLGAAAAMAKEKGWTACKFGVVSRGNETEHIEQAVAKVSSIRKAAGERFDIGLELAECLTPRSAVRFSDALAPYHPMFLEEITWRENPEAMTAVAEKIRIPLATGEGLQSRFEFRRLLDAKGAAIVQPDVLHCAGITELRRIASLAETFGVEVAPHQCYGPVAHVASINSIVGCRNFFIQEWEAQDDPLFQEVTGGAYPVQKDGLVTLPQGPGLGISMDFAAFCRRFPFKSRTNAWM